jgi:predicted dehydrogenase
MVDWTLNLAGSKVDWVAGFSQKLLWTDASIEDEARAVIRFASGCVGDVLVSHIRNLPGKPKWEVMGAKANAVSYWSNAPIELTRQSRGRTVTEYVPLPRREWGKYYRNVVKHILDGKKLLVTPESAARVIAVIEAQAKSAETGKTVKVSGE